MNGRIAGVVFVLSACVVLTATEVRAAKDKAAEKKVSLLSPMAELKSRRANIIHLQGLRSKILEYLVETDNLDNVNLYVEDLNSGVWMGINERYPSRLASLTKVGVLIAWLRYDESQPGVLEKRVQVQESHREPNDRFALAFDTAVAPGSYRVLTLLEKMIVNSDNTALTALLAAIPNQWVVETFSDIGVPNPFSGTEKDESFGRMSPKQYGQMLKALYNASYLDLTHSEMALRLMTRTKFTLGLRSILPKESTAALKYGVLENNAMHESGIVYRGDNPYIACIFTKLTGTAVEKNLVLIRELGTIVDNYFRYIDK